MGRKLIVGLTIFILAIALYGAWDEYKNTDIVSNLSRPNNYGDGLRTEVRLVLRKLDLISNRVIGTVRVSIRSTSEKMFSEARKMKAAQLWFSRFIFSDSKDYGVSQGGSHSPVELKMDLGGNIVGSGSFEWLAHEITVPFLYPFDSYKLYVNPSVSTSTGKEIGWAPGIQIDTLVAYQKIPNLRMAVTSLKSENRSADWYEIYLDRPVALKLITITIILLWFVWLIYLTRFGKVENYVGRLVLFFVSLVGVRATLLVGVGIFPLLIDYIILCLSIGAVGIVLEKWARENTAVNQIVCPDCKMTIAPDATRCPFCTTNLSQ